MRAAMLLHVPPWELMQQSSVWVDWALVTNLAMIEAQEIIAKKAEK